MEVAISGSRRLRRARSTALLVGLPVLMAVMLGSAYLINLQAVRQSAQWWVYILSAVVCAALIVPTCKATRRGQNDRLEWIGLLLLALFSLVVLVRVAALLFDVAPQDPAMSLFRPTFAFLPVLYLGGMLLLPSRRALAAGWALWLTVLALLAISIHSNGWPMQRNGLPELLVWLLLGNPLFLLVLHALPGLEDALHSSAEEISELRETNRLMERINASERRFNLVVDSLQVGVWDHRFEQGVMVERWWSPRFYALTGYSSEELPPNEDSSRKLFGDAAADLHETLYVQLRDRGVTSLDARMHTKDRGWRWVNIACKAELDDQGHYTRITGAIEDIHQRRMAEMELREAQAELTALAYLDALTGMHNRRAFDEQLQREWDRARRNGKPLALLTLDIDWFKRFNDHYGHPAGDECLRQMAEVIGQCLRRPGDFAGRVGGEEFQVVMPETDTAGALLVANLMLATLQERALPHADSPLGRVTCSIGVAALVVAPADRLQTLVDSADAQLYESKRLGRARVSAASVADTPA
ncbi:MAG: sensor domain-containing diguanylate cyclase [Pseudomonadota bacterium]